MSITKKLSGFFLLIIIIVSSLGVSFYLHECECRGSNLYSIGTGFSGSQDFCCCSNENIVYSSCNPKGNIHKEGCCKDFVYFYLVPFAPEKVASVIPFLPEKNLVSFIFIKLQVLNQITEIISYPLLHSPPEKLSGKNLVFFIQQIKIPFPVC
jgi:hypothetical protein